MNPIYKEFQFGNDTVVMETNKVAKQATGSVTVTIGNTVVLTTVVGAKSPRPGQDFFPLTVNYQEKTYAAGKIPGGFFRREGRPSEKETLTCRLIDRPIRPLFPKGFMNEVQVVCTVLSADKDQDPDIAAMIGTSAALAISGIPFNGPLGAARVGYIDGNYILNPGYETLKESMLSMTVAGTESAVLMVESEAKEMTQKRRLFSLAIAVSMFTLTVAGLCLLRGMEDILADQSSKPTLLSSDMHVGKDNKSSKSKLHRHLVKKEMDKKSAADAQDNGAVPAKAQFKDFISSPFSLFIPFFTTYYTTSSSDKDAKSLAAPTDDEWNPFVVALSNVTVDPLSNGTLTIIDFEDDDNATAIDDEMQESLFEEAAESNFLTSPDGKSYQVKANLPGVEKEDISAKIYFALKDIGKKGEDFLAL